MPLVIGPSYFGFSLIDADTKLLGFYVTTLDGVTPLPAAWDGYQIRYLLIPGGISLAAERSAGIDYSDYEAVKAYYRIGD